MSSTCCLGHPNLRTQLGKRPCARVDLPAKHRQCQKRTLEGETNHCVKSLTPKPVRKGLRAKFNAAYEPNESETVLPFGVLWQQRLRPDVRDKPDSHNGGQRDSRGFCKWLWGWS